MNATIIETSNFLVMLLAAFGVYSVVSWKLNKKITRENKEAVIAWAWIFGAVGLSAGWFAISRHTATPGQAFNLTMYDWRWALKIITAFGFSWGMLKFIGMIEGFTRTKKAIYFSIFFAFALVMGVV